MADRPRLRRWACRLRDHDDVVAGVLAHVGAALLVCDRCGRRAAVPYRGAAPPTFVEHAARYEVVLVDHAALDLLRWSEEAGAAVVASLLDEGGPP